MPDEKPPIHGNIRDFELLAGVDGGKFPRLGVLRMDVDNLGQLFQPPDPRSLARHLQPLTFTRLMAASDALSLFFEGYLPQLCRETEVKKERPNSIYLLYGGGDDLFIGDEWALIPDLATEIRDAFSTFCDGQLSISAGIVLVTANFPFYRAADAAKAALDNGAKQYDQRGDDAPEKDAIQFLGTTLPWEYGESWRTVNHQRQRLVELADQLKSDAITRTVQRMYTRWDADRRSSRHKNAIYLGPFMWLQAYQMQRLMEQYKTSAVETKKVQNQMLQPDTIRLAGVSARWAELIRRASSNEENE